MSWFKFDDNAVDHPKLASLTDRAFRWWVKGLSYASRFLTDGVLHPVFWKQVPKQSRAELTGARLWDWDDPNFQIHDYLHHQLGKHEIELDKERNREKAKKFRERRRAERRKGDASPVALPVTQPGDVTDSAAGDVTDHIREHIQITPTHTPNTQQTTPTASHGGGQLIITATQWQKLMESHAYVGAILRVPKVLHSELMAKSGANSDAELRKWYEHLDADLEQSGKGTGDVFAWLRPRHQAFALSRGWIDAAPKAEKPTAKPFSIQEVLDKRAGKVS